jgi:hypothetical protein
MQVLPLAREDGRGDIPSLRVGDDSHHALDLRSACAALRADIDVRRSL